MNGMSTRPHTYTGAVCTIPARGGIYQEMLSMEWGKGGTRDTACHSCRPSTSRLSAYRWPMLPFDKDDAHAMIRQ